ncbi:MAG TPA: hypothetical protein VD948_13040 [Rhodothermales bacterium]|nr:hypothetical protein [Rhodothermales bacterium]
MATAYNIVSSRVAHLLNSLAGATNSAADTNYLVAPLTSTQLDDPRYPRSAIWDAILDAEVQVIKAIVMTKNHPERQGFLTLSANVANGTALGTIVNRFSGPFDSIVDATDNTQVLAPAPLEEVREIVAQTALYTLSYYLYALDGMVLFHTRTNVKIRGPVVARADYTAFTGSANMSCPDVYVDAIVAGALSMLFGKEGNEAQLAQYFAGRFREAIDDIKQGAREIVPITVPTAGF